MVARPLVGVQCQKAQLLELNLIEGKLGLCCAQSHGIECEQFNLTGDLALMGQELELRKIDDTLELENDLLRISAILLGLPAFGVDSGVEELGHWVAWVLPRAINDLVSVLHLIILHL